MDVTTKLADRYDDLARYAHAKYSYPEKCIQNILNIFSGSSYLL